MLPPAIGLEIANRSYAALASYGLKSAHYPAPGTLPQLPSLIVVFDGEDGAESNEQILTLRFRGLLFTAVDAVDSEIVAIDALIFPLRDTFSPNLNPNNYRLRTADGQGVEFCMYMGSETAIPVKYNGVDHYGGRVRWNVKIRRYAGDA